MSDTAPDDFDLQALLVQIERNKAETAKLNSETAKLVAEANKFGAEQNKLQRDRALSPWLIVIPIATGVLSGTLGPLLGLLVGFYLTHLVK